VGPFRWQIGSDHGPDKTESWLQKRKTKETTNL
jgi:hypothetical protein